MSFVRKHRTAQQDCPTLLLLAAQDIKLQELSTWCLRAGHEVVHHRQANLVGRQVDHCGIELFMNRKGLKCHWFSLTSKLYIAVSKMHKGVPAGPRNMGHNAQHNQSAQYDVRGEVHLQILHCHTSQKNLHKQPITSPSTTGLVTDASEI